MVRVVDTRGDFKNFLTYKDQMNPLEAYQKYYFEPNQEIMAGLAVTHTKNGYKELKETLQAINWTYYEGQYIKSLEKDFIDKTSEILERAEQVLPEPELFPAECYLVFGYNTMTGCSTMAGFNLVIGIGLERVADFTSFKSYQDLLIHEYSHLIRMNQFRALEEMAQMPLLGEKLDLKLMTMMVTNLRMKCRLIDEGLAVLAPAMVGQEKITDRRLQELLFYSTEQFKAIEGMARELWRDFRTLMESSDQENIYKWFSSANYSSNLSIPERSGYYLGAKIILHILQEKGFDFYPQLFTMTADEVLALIPETIF